MRLWKPCKAPCTLSVKLSDLTVWRHTCRKNCAVLTGNGAGLRIVLSSRLSHRELRSSLRKSHSFLSLPADTTMASSQGTQFIQQMSIPWYIPFQIPLLTPHFTLFFPSFRITLWPMWLANSKRQPCFYPPESHAQETHRTDKPGGKSVLCQRIFSSFFVQFFIQLNCTV
jgi:hypothetical protein